MTTTHRRILGAGIAATAIAAFVAGTPAVAGAAPSQGQPQPDHRAAAVDQRLPRQPRGAADACRCAADVDPARTFAGGAENLATKLTELRTEAGRRQQPHRRRGRPHRWLRPSSPACSTTSRRSSRSTPWAWTSAASATTSSTRAPTELLRMQKGGCHPVDGCYFPGRAVRRCRLPVARRQRRQEGRRRHAAARHLGQGDRRHQGRLHRDDPRGHADHRQPLRRRRPSTSRTRSRRPTPRRRCSRSRASRRSSCSCTRAASTAAPTTSASASPTRSRRWRPSSAPRSTRSSPVTPTTPTSAPSPTRPATRASSRARPPRADGHRDLARHQHAQRRGRPRPHHRRRTTSCPQTLATTRRRPAIIAKWNTLAGPLKSAGRRHARRGHHR